MKIIQKPSNSHAIHEYTMMPTYMNYHPVPTTLTIEVYARLRSVRRFLLIIRDSGG